MENIYDTIIVGAGPAGLTAAIYAKRREMNTLIISKDIGGQLMWVGDIENYPGYMTIKGPELISKLYEQISHLGVKITNNKVKEIIKEDDHYILVTEKERYITRTVIVTMGLVPNKLNVPGENEFVGKGVSYCANCDGPFFRDKTVAVIGGGNAALDAAEVMSKIAKKVYLIQNLENFTGFEVLVDEVKSRSNIEIHYSSNVIELSGQNKLEKIKIINHKNKDEITIDIDGVFIEIGRCAKTDLVKDLVKVDERNQIIVNDCCSTSQLGIFAAGDTTQVPFKQITIACGQGAIAALAAYQYLQLKSNKRCKVCCPPK